MNTGELPIRLQRGLEPTDYGNQFGDIESETSRQEMSDQVVAEAEKICGWLSEPTKERAKDIAIFRLQDEDFRQIMLFEYNVAIKKLERSGHRLNDFWQAKIALYSIKRDIEEFLESNKRRHVLDDEDGGDGQKKEQLN
jgi:hypothetical protein